MKLNEITLLDKDGFEQYKSLIPAIYEYWWLKTAYFGLNNIVYAVNASGDLDTLYCNDDFVGVRLFCTFEPEVTDSVFWQKPEKAIGSKIKFGKYEWTILDVRNNELYALSDSLMTSYRFDSEGNVWEESELRRWLETESEKRI